MTWIRQWNRKCLCIQPTVDCTSFNSDIQSNVNNLQWDELACLMAWVMGIIAWFNCLGCQGWHWQFGPVASWVIDALTKWTNQNYNIINEVLTLHGYRYWCHCGLWRADVISLKTVLGHCIYQGGLAIRRALPRIAMSSGIIEDTINVPHVLRLQKYRRVVLWPVLQSAHHWAIPPHSWHHYHHYLHLNLELKWEEQWGMQQEDALFDHGQDSTTLKFLTQNLCTNVIGKHVTTFTPHAYPLSRCRCWQAQWTCYFTINCKHRRHWMTMSKPLHQWSATLFSIFQMLTDMLRSLCWVVSHLCCRLIGGSIPPIWWKGTFHASYYHQRGA